MFVKKIISLSAIMMSMSTAIAGPVITNIGTLGGVVSQSYSLSSSGGALAGTSTTNSNTPAFAVRWTPGGGLQSLGTLGGAESEGFGISGDGTTVTGSAFRPGRRLLPHAFRWTQAGGMQDLGAFGPGDNQSVGYGISDDGNTIAGWSGSGSGNRAFRWTLSGGMQNLGTLGGSESWGYGLSRDGGTVVGDSITTGGTKQAFRWTSAGGMVGLGTLGGTRSESAGTHRVSRDGSVIVGSSTLIGDSVTRAFRWTPSGGMQGIGTLGGVYESASTVSSDGMMISGISEFPVGSGVSSVPFIWTQETGMLSLVTYFVGLGVDLSEWSRLSSASAISDDKTVMTGVGVLSNGQVRGWVVSGIPSPSAAALLGLGGLIVARRRR
jgi:probable HAF family extracellular repeat protein